MIISERFLTVNKNRSRRWKHRGRRELRNVVLIMKSEKKEGKMCAGENYIQNRLLKQIEYYRNQAAKLQKEYYIGSTIGIVILAIIPVITLLPEDYIFYKYLIAGASAISSILSSILLMRKTKDNWLEYRATSESLQSELEKYYCKAGSYNKSEEGERLRILVDTCEGIMKAEHSGWYDRMKADSSQE